MHIPVPRGILYLILSLTLQNLSTNILGQTFMILAESINDMNNHTLMAHFGIAPTPTSVSFLNSLITSSETIGMFLSLLFIIPIADTKGKKFLIVYVGSAISILSAICQLFSAYLQATESYIISQFLGGLHHPIQTLVTLLFAIECAPDRNRGFACSALIFTSGIAPLLMQFKLPIASPDLFGKRESWYVFPLAALICACLTLILNVRLPESPKFLVCQNEEEKATRSISYYYGESYITNDVLLTLIKEKNLTRESHISLKQMWINDTMRQGLKILLSYSCIVSFSSEYEQAVYSILLHKSAGFTVQEAININLIISIVFIPSQFIGPVIIDYLGRRPVMFIAGVMMYVKSWLILVTQLVIQISGASLLTKILFVFNEIINPSATGVESLKVLFIMELFPPSARTAVSQTILFINLAINSSLLSCFPIIYSFFPPGPFIPFVITQLFFGIYLYRYMPETKNRAVCDIIETLDEQVASRTASFAEEITPLIRKRSSTVAFKRNSTLNTQRARALTVDQKLIPKKWNC